MDGFTRYAIYYAPEPGPLAAFGAGWLGWDAARATIPPRPQVDGLPCAPDQITGTVRKYGFHGTLKPPFRLAEGCSADALHTAITALARLHAPVKLDGLVLARIGQFLALVPDGPATALASLASHTVMELDSFRAPPSEAEIAARNPAALSPTQAALLQRWGYPYVMEEFRFHLTLTGRLSGEDLDSVHAALTPHLDPLLPQPFDIASLCPFGEAADGMFHLLHRYALSG